MRKGETSADLPLDLATLEFLDLGPCSDFLLSEDCEEVRLGHIRENSISVGCKDHTSMVQQEPSFPPLEGPDVRRSRHFCIWELDYTDEL